MSMDYSYTEERLLSFTILGGMKHYLMERREYERNEYDEMVLVNRETFIESLPYAAKPIRRKAVDARQMELVFN